MSRRNMDRLRRMAIARAEGIVFTPRGEPLFERDRAHWEEIQRRDLRGDRQKDDEEGEESE